MEDFLIEPGIWFLKRDVGKWKSGYVEVFKARDVGYFPMIFFCNGEKQHLLCTPENRHEWYPLLDAMDNVPESVKNLMKYLEIR